MFAAGSLPAGPPAGFPRCGPCPYGRTGPAWICVACAGSTFAPITQPACPVCSQALPGGGPCRNALCADGSRRIARISAIAFHSGTLREVIRQYKYTGHTGWGLIFGRLVLGWLEAHAAGSPPDLIVANPTYHAGGRFAHTEYALHNAADADLQRRWPFDLASPRAVVKTGATPSSAGGSLTAKRAAAAALRQSLHVPDPSRTAGRRILVYDDVCTTGSQLNAVADCLLTDGKAAHVEALVLARAPWQ